MAGSRRIFWRPLLLTVLLLLALDLASSATHAYAAGDDLGGKAGAYIPQEPSAIDVWAENTAAAIDKARGVVGAALGVEAGASGSQQRYRTKLTLPCGAADPNGGVNGAINACDTIPLDCAGDEVRRWVWVAPVDDTDEPTGPYRRVAESCGDPAAPLEAVTPAMTQADFERLPLQPAPLTVQPPDNIALINFPANVYVEPAVAELDTVLAGVPMRVRATPVEFSYDFGDGTVIGPTSDTGKPVPQWISDVPVDEVERHLQVAHSYTEDSTFAITVTTHYRGEYAIAGGPWLPIEGQATVTGEPYPVEILTVTPRLVADTLE